MRLLAENCVGLIVDMQEKLFPHIHEKEELLKKLSVLIKGLHELRVNTLITEQYPQGLGSTIAPVKELWQENFAPVEKISFSCLDNDKVKRRLEFFGKNTLIIAGIETHVCIMQTAMDALEHDLLPVVVADAVSSRNLYDKEIALRRMQNEGAIITTVESILLELCRVAGTEKFKVISKLIK